MCRCKLEVKLAGHKAVSPCAASAGGVARESPPVVVASLNLRCVLNAKQQNEIVSASVVVARAVGVDAPMAREEWNTLAQLRHFTVVRRLEGQAFPPGWDLLVAQENAQHPVAKATGGLVLSSQANERGLLSFLLARIQASALALFSRLLRHRLVLQLWPGCSVPALALDAEAR